jgi:DNA repair protein RecO
MHSRSYSLQALVLKRSSVGETDRVVTLLTQERGKLVCVAKGVRKLNSSKRAYMEPGNLIKAYLVKTKSLPLLIQAQLIHDAAPVKTNLATLRQLVQILEVYDKLFVEEKLPAKTYQLALDIRTSLLNSQTQLIRGQLKKLILQLGFPLPDKNKYDSILDYVQEIAERPMKSFEYLQVKSST